MKILVTGGAGFIGSHVVETLREAGHAVCVVDNLSRGRRENLPEGVTLHELSITAPDIDEVIRAEAPTVIVHHAAQVSVSASVRDPQADLSVNIAGTVNLLQSAVRHGIEKFIFASTGGAIYGEQQYFPADEDHPTCPLSPYGIGKLAAEHYLRCYHATRGLEYTILRYSNVYGPRQDPFGEGGVVAIFSRQLLDGRQPTINGTGEQIRDFVYVKDVARANLLALQPGCCESVNIATGRETSVNELFSLLCQATGSTRPADHGPALPGEVFRSVLSAERARAVLGWAPQMSLQNGLSETVAHFARADRDHCVNRS